MSKKVKLFSLLLILHFLSPEVFVITYSLDPVNKLAKFNEIYQNKSLLNPRQPLCHHSHHPSMKNLLLQKFSNFKFKKIMPVNLSPQN